MLRWKQFVRESHTFDFEEKTEQALTNQTLKGEEARQFYEEIIQEPSTSQTVTQRKTCGAGEKRHRISRLPREDGSRAVRRVPKTDNIWKAAETNDSFSLKILLSGEIDVNAKDPFGWTGLMCASCSGAEDCVKILLDTGADQSVRDRAGYNALNLAKKNRHEAIVKILQTKACTGAERRVSSSPSEPRVVSHYCEPCAKRFKTSQRKHEASTTHLLAVGGKNQKTFYGIPDSNRGFQLLMRNGWDREQGLGPEGTGRKYPVKTTQKHDRSGVGAVSKRKTKDSREQDNSQTDSCGPRPSRSRNDRNFERNFRQEFS